MNHLQNILPLSNFTGRLNLPTSQNNSTMHVYTHGNVFYTTI